MPDHEFDLSRGVRPGSGFVEVADRCWVARFDFLDVNVGLVGGESGLLVVDTHASEVEARAVVDQVRRLGVGEVVAVVNTHEHFDHTFGNVVFAEAYDVPPIYAHEEAAAGLATTGPELQREAASDDSDPRHGDIAATRIMSPTQTFSSARVVDLGDRLVELVHPGRGHTAGDAVVRVDDADVVFAGDLVEESTIRSGVPGFGADCFPMEWPASLDLLIGLLTPGSVVVPGHGTPVDKDFVDEQRGAIGVVAETIRDLVSRGVPVGDALAAAEWPYPAEQLGERRTPGVRAAAENLEDAAAGLSGLLPIGPVGPSAIDPSHEENRGGPEPWALRTATVLVWLSTRWATPTSSPRWPGETRTRSGGSTSRHAAWIAARLAPRCSDREAVADALQDTFVAAWNGAQVTGATGRSPAGSGASRCDAWSAGCAGTAAACRRAPRCSSRDHADLGSGGDSAADHGVRRSRARSGPDLARATGGAPGGRTGRSDHPGGRARCCGSRREPSRPG